MLSRTSCSHTTELVQELEQCHAESTEASLYMISATQENTYYQCVTAKHSTTLATKLTIIHHLFYIRLTDTSKSLACEDNEHVPDTAIALSEYDCRVPVPFEVAWAVRYYYCATVATH
jgi:hypothetical protein